MKLIGTGFIFGIGIGIGIQVGTAIILFSLDHLKKLAEKELNGATTGDASVDDGR